MNKRGFIRTLEAVVAIIIVFLFIYYAGRSSDKDERFVQGIKSLEESILNDISKNDGFRDCIVSSDVNAFNELAGKSVSNCMNQKHENQCAKGIDCYIEGSLPLKYKNNYAFTICSPTDSGGCSIPGSIGKSKEVYTSAVIISSSLNNKEYSPRVLRMWLY